MRWVIVFSFQGAWYMYVDADTLTCTHTYLTDAAYYQIKE